MSAITSVGITPPEVLHYLYKSFFIQSINRCFTTKPFLYGNGHHRVVCEITTVTKQWKIFLSQVIELIDRSDDITNNSSVHNKYKWLGLNKLNNMAQIYLLSYYFKRNELSLHFIIYKHYLKSIKNGLF